MPTKTWVVGEEVLAADFNNYVQTQVVARFATAAARDTAWPAATAGAGAVSVTTDTSTLWIVVGGAWVAAVGGPWTTPTLGGAWVPVGGVWQAPQYRKVGDCVEIRGTVMNGTIGATVFTLPVGFRPPAGLSMPATGGTVVGELVVSSAGDVLFQSGSTARASLNCRFSVTA